MLLWHFSLVSGWSSYKLLRPSVALGCLLLWEAHLSRFGTSSRFVYCICFSFDSVRQPPQECSCSCLYHHLWPADVTCNSMLLGCDILTGTHHADWRPYFASSVWIAFMQSSLSSRYNFTPLLLQQIWDGQSPCTVLLMLRMSGICLAAVLLLFCCSHVQVCNKLHATCIGILWWGQPY